MAKKTKRNKGPKRRLMIFGTISVVIIVYVVFNAVYYVTSINSLNNEFNALETQKLNLLEEEKSLKAEITRLNDPEYLARYAKENYLYSKDGEIVIKLEKQAETKTVSNPVDYDIITYVGVGLVIFVMIIVMLPKGKRKEA